MRREGWRQREQENSEKGETEKLDEGQSKQRIRRKGEVRRRTGVAARC
jgi:hypothetical protein